MCGCFACAQESAEPLACSFFSLPFNTVGFSPFTRIKSLRRFPRPLSVFLVSPIEFHLNQLLGFQIVFGSSTAQTPQPISKMSHRLRQVVCPHFIHAFHFVCMYTANRCSLIVVCIHHLQRSYLLCLRHHFRALIRRAGFERRLRRVVFCAEAPRMGLRKVAILVARVLDVT